MYSTSTMNAKLLELNMVLCNAIQSKKGVDKTIHIASFLLVPSNPRKTLAV